MKLFRAKALVFGVLCIVFLRPDSATARRTQPRPEVIRVGITEYQNVEEVYAKYETLFKELAASAEKGESVTFSIAIGTYGEVLDWYNTRKIDVAILSAMPVAELLINSEANNLTRAYLGDLSVSPKKSSSQQSLLDQFPEPKDPFTYRTGCFVLDSDKELQTIDDIKALWEKQKLLKETLLKEKKPLQKPLIKFLFVRPYSLSGYLVPLSVLRERGIEPLEDADNFEFTYQHGRSLENMLCSLRRQAQNGNPETHLVAFVLDDTRYDPGQVAATARVFRKIPIKELDDYRIPREIVLSNYNQERDEIGKDGYDNRYDKCTKMMKRMFEKWHPGTMPKKQSQRLAHPEAGDQEIEWRPPVAAWTRNYANVQAVLRKVNLPKQLLYRSNFDDLLDDLAKSKAPRLALVLSGGGAKCAYQAGAVVEIEKKLKQRNLNIGLVVGTSGGAINALMVALGITRDDFATQRLKATWERFRQQQFIRPSGRFNLVFGLCVGLLQALLIVVAVLLFDRETMDWRGTTFVLPAIALIEVLVAIYFQVPASIIVLLLGTEAIVIGLVIGLVQLFDYLVDRTRFLANLPHWRRLTIVLLLTFGTAEFLVAKASWIGNLVNHINESHYNHWVDHIWTLVILVSVWSFPYPLLIAVAITILGWFVMPGFDWTKWREPLVWWMTIALAFLSLLLVLEGLFKESSPSKASGIEETFSTQIPTLIKDTVDPSFVYTPMDNKTALESVSQEIMDHHLLQRDLVITTSKLPVRETKNSLSVNSLPDDLYFYYRTNQDETVKPPADRRFVPLKYNQDKLLDVVIGSSTIYPIFPSRLLNPPQPERLPKKQVWLGSEESRSEPIEGELRVIDGGFIHNTPLQAATAWGATHIIVVEASPAQQQMDPRDLWDNALMAFGYLFAQAQRSDSLLRGETETFELRPKSDCEKLNVKAICAGKEGKPAPDMDTFDFSSHATGEAFLQGQEDVKNTKPLFTRVPGAPLFRNVTANNQTKKVAPNLGLPWRGVPYTPVDCAGS